MAKAWLVEYKDGTHDIFTDQCFAEFEVGLLGDNTKAAFVTRMDDFQETMEEYPEAGRIY